MGKFIDLTGTKVGKWTVVSLGPKSKTSTQWNCKCDCGVEKLVRAAHLSTGKSTGCSACGRGHTKHGGAAGGVFTKKYKTWRSMKLRCCTPSHQDYERYKGLLCEEWMEFKAFDEYMPEPPDDALTIDRIENDKGYEPGNVRWATWTEQHRNQSNNWWIEFDGKRQLLVDWSRELKIKAATLAQRIRAHGIDKAMVMPPPPPIPKFTVN